MIFVDSSVWIDYINDLDSAHTEKLEQILGRREVVVGDLVLAEVLQGCNDPKLFKETVRLFRLADFVVVGSYRIAVEASLNYIALRAKGITIRKTVDTLIATRCIVDKYELLHNDRDFLPFEEHLGLKCVI
jgi:predicted nucleic acid-binding protein